MAEEEVLIEVEAVLAVYGDDCVILDSFPPHLHLHIKPRTADISSQQFVEAVIGIRAGPQYPSKPPWIDLIESKGLDGERQKQLITGIQEKARELSSCLMLVALCEPLPGGGTCGGTSASTDKDACPPLELSVAAMKPDGSVTTESFKPCQLLPEQWTPLKHSTCRKECRGSTSYSTEVLERVPNPMESAMSLNGSAFINKLKELYIASVAQHAQEKIRHAQEMAAIEARHTAAKDRHAQEMAAAKDRHDQEMAAAKDRHDQEMAAAKERHDQEIAAAKDRHAQEMAAAKERHDQEMAAVKTEYLGNLDLMFDDIDFDQLGFDGDTHM